MATALYENVIFGPVKSRRLGLSLGVNLLPTQQKLCNFECIYCECGWTKPIEGYKCQFNPKADVTKLLEAKLREMVAQKQIPDVITFAGNGEPTMHPEFEQIIEDTIKLRDKIVPTAKISVLSNATMIGNNSVRNALLKVDNNILKLDSAFDQTVMLMDRPRGRYSVEQTVQNMIKFQGEMILQTMFVTGECEGQIVDNTTDMEVNGWLECVKQIRPKMVMIYTIDRDTPLESLNKVSVEKLNQIAAKIKALGIECSVSA